LCATSLSYSPTLNPVAFSGGGFFFENPIGVAIQIFTMLTIGWPLYLLTNVTGQSYKNEDGSPQWVSHFHPNRLFRSSYHGVSQSAFVLLSDAGLVVMVALLACFCNQFGFLCMMRVYGVPYLIVNFWLVLITELQHTDTRLPHYSGNEWNYLRGALATVDRDYGILNAVFHHIGDTHVCHHLYANFQCPPPYSPTPIAPVIAPFTFASAPRHSSSGFPFSLTTMLKRPPSTSNVC
jgi:hypothetical protein